MASGNRPHPHARRLLVLACGALVILMVIAGCTAGAPDLDEPGTFSPTSTATPAG